LPFLTADRTDAALRPRPGPDVLLRQGYVNRIQPLPSPVVPLGLLAAASDQEGATACHRRPEQPRRVVRGIAVQFVQCGDEGSSHRTSST
jgi:hypothetical protein